MERSTGHSQPATLALYQHTSFFGKMSFVRGTAASELGEYAFGLSLTVRCLKGHQAPVQATNVVLLAPIVRLTERRRLIGLVAQVSKSSSPSSRGGRRIRKKLSYAQLGGPAALHVFARPPTAASSLVGVDNAEILRQGHRPCPLVDVKFDENARHIGLHGLRRNRKATCNFLVGVPLSHQIYDISLALT